MIKMPKEKFSDLKECLQRETRNNFYLSFAEIEEIIGQPLCPSAYKYLPYWHPTVTHTLAVMIYDCDYSIEADLIQKRIKLSRRVNK